MKAVAYKEISAVQCGATFFSQLSCTNSPLSIYLHCKYSCWKVHLLDCFSSIRVENCELSWCKLWPLTWRTPFSRLTSMVYTGPHALKFLVDHPELANLHTKTWNMQCTLVQSSASDRVVWSLGNIFTWPKYELKNLSSYLLQRKPGDLCRTASPQN